MLNKKLIACVLGAAVALPVFAEDQPGKKESPPVFKAKTSQAQLKSFVYSPNKVYEIQTHIGMWTVITLQDDEHVIGFLPSDTTFWDVKLTNDRKRVLVRPKEAERFNSGSLATNKRTYELTFKSYGEGVSWYQRVSWNFNEDADPAFGVFRGDAVSLSQGRQNQQVEKRVKPIDRTESSPDPTNWKVDISKAHFDYQIKNPGNAQFAPLRVFDDGTFTYIQMPHLQDLPAVFSVDKDGSIRIVDYVVKNNYIMVHRVLPGLLFKLNESEVVVERHG